MRPIDRPSSPESQFGRASCVKEMHTLGIGSQAWTRSTQNVGSGETSNHPSQKRRQKDLNLYGYRYV